MGDGIPLIREGDAVVSGEEQGPLRNLEEKIGGLLAKYQDLLKERDELAVALDLERGKANQLEKKLELLSKEREKVKTRVDQLLHRLKDIDI